jgi:DNA end-binding protein Ku
VPDDSVIPSEARDLQSEDYGKPFWTGTVSFGLVNVPVGLFPASRSLGAAMRVVSEKGTPLKRAYVDQEGNTLEWDEIVRGYEVEKGKFVVIEDEELERLAPEKTNNIDLRVFVPKDDIDQILFVRAYYMVPTGANTKAYRLLAQVMEETGLAGVATFVMRAKEYIAAIFADHGILRAETLRFSDEIRTPKSIGLPEVARVSASDVSKAEKAIAKLTEAKFSENDLEDTAAVKLFSLIEKKASKDQDVVELPKEEKDEPRATTLDLMAALERSLTKGKQSAKPTRARRKRATR